MIEANDFFNSESLDFCLIFAKYISSVPDYLITIHLKSVKHLQGIRWHPGDDINAIRELVRKKIIDRVSSFNLDWIDVAPTARNNGSKMQTKPLVP